MYVNKPIEKNELLDDVAPIQKEAEVK